MNKYQEALIKLINHNLSTTEIIYLSYEDQENIFELLQELADKETPMKPSILWMDDQGFIQANCKICDSSMYYKQERCSSASCGRVADWSVEE